MNTQHTPDAITQQTEAGDFTAYDKTFGGEAQSLNDSDIDGAA